MKAYLAMTAAGLGLLGMMGPAPAQGFRDRDYESRDRGDGYRDRGDGYRERGGGGGGGGGNRERGYGGGFDEREYLRCNPDVRRSVARGDTESGALHYRIYGRREGRQLSC